MVATYGMLSINTDAKAENHITIMLVAKGSPELLEAISLKAIL